MNLVSPDPLPAPRTPSQAQAASQGGARPPVSRVTVPASQLSGRGDWQQDDVMTSDPSQEALRWREGELLTSVGGGQANCPGSEPGDLQEGGAVIPGSPEL
ncbi:hypothetical protein JEQ12_000006 [Ovis aries]|uniref:Uncharacterized protein n=1 Tax=Ovis aries TaxID=9940 RepID=A0A836D7K8_SHEEP|nr:hypothetical protein JEQ12_000006 [Ovis aries]